MSNIIKHYSKNTKGKDYVVGDIHGAFKKLYKILEKLGFNFQNDRLFSVGDLCDRGPDSPDVEHWLKYPWFHPIMGNHEQMLLLYESNRYKEKDFMMAGGYWWPTMPQESKDFIIYAFQKLPIAIEVETSNGLVGIIHAHCPHADWNKLEGLLTGMHRVKMTNKALWSMDTPLYDDVIQNVKAVIVGHMTQEEYIIKGNVHLIDTGGMYSEGKFTILELETLQEVT